MNRGWSLEDATQIQRLVRPSQEFAKLEASGGILLIGCTIAALDEVAHQV
jgi:Na+/H+ antiporter NhaA